MAEITMEIPEASLRALGVLREQAGNEIRMLAGVKSFELRRLSSGAAAKLADVFRVAFLEVEGIAL